MGKLVHLDVKKVGQIPPGGVWRIHGRNSAQAKRSKRRPVGYTYLHVAIDDYSARRLRRGPRRRDRQDAGGVLAQSPGLVLVQRHARR